MITRAKYVVIEYAPLCGLRVPVILPKDLEHSSARSIGKPVSAGFCAIAANGQVTTWGNSISLGVGSNDGDAALIAKWFGLGSQADSTNFTQGSSEVECQTHTLEVAGSIPAPAPKSWRDLVAPAPKRALPSLLRRFLPKKT